MRIIYRLSILALLASGASACSSDPKVATEATQPKTLPEARPVKPATARRPTTLHSATAAQVDESQSVEAPAPRAATRAVTKQLVVAARLPVLPNPVAAVAAASGVAVGPPATAAAESAATPAAAATSIQATDQLAAESDVRAYCAATLAPAQVFWVRPSRDTVLVGQQGTRVAVPANVWAVPAGRPAVRVELQEFYTTPDIVLAGLSTRAGANLLETGGMVNLTATVNQQPIALRTGQRLLLQMPTTRRVEGMQLFQDASAAGQHGTNWQLPAPAPDESRSVKEFDLLKDGRYPQLAGGDKALLKFFDKRVPNTRAIMARLRRYRPATDQEKLLLKESSKANRKKVLCAVQVKVTVDSTGAAHFTPMPYGDDEVKATLLATAQQLPKWRPARFRRLAAPHRLEKVEAVGVLTMLYTSSGKRLLGVQWDHEATHEPRFERYAAQQRQEGRRRFAAQFASNGPLKLDESLYYEFETDGLGWINCDRFLEEGPRVEFAVQTPQSNTVVTLVFKQQRSILASSRTEPSAAVFAQVPAGATATVVAVRREQGVTYLATTPVTLGQETPPTLEFKSVSLTELRSTLAQL